MAGQDWSNPTLHRSSDWPCSLEHRKVFISYRPTLPRFIRTNTFRKNELAKDSVSSVAPINRRKSYRDRSVAKSFLPKDKSNALFDQDSSLADRSTARARREPRFNDESAIFHIFRVLDRPRLREALPPCVRDPEQ